MRYLFVFASLLLAACYNKDYYKPYAQIEGSLIIGDSLYRVRIDTTAKDTIRQYTIGNLPQSEADITPANYSFSPYLGDDSMARFWSSKHGFKTFIALDRNTSRHRLYYRYIAPGDSLRIIDISAGKQDFYKLTDPHRQGWTFVTADKGGSWINGDCYLPGGDMIIRWNWVIGPGADQAMR
jgi:hypothetical protein